MHATRRQLLTAAIGLASMAPFATFAQSSLSIHVRRDPGCGCCSSWIEILRKQGFPVTEERSSNSVLVRYKMDKGIPVKMMSCHTGEIQGYVIEGHVPARDIRRLLAARPDAIGLAVPGMPYGSPGMGPEDEREAYPVFLIRRDGRTEVFTKYDAA